ncbi:MAG: hypothetical protein ACOVS5_18335 [Oligoflexus sp.]
MDKILKFMEFACIDPRLYWRIPTRDGEILYEIQWRREDRIRWRFRPVGALFWELGTDEGLIAQLELAKLDLEQFETQIHSTVLQQVCFAARIVSDAKTLLGEATVEQAIQDHKSFLQQLESAIVKLTQSRPVSKPRLQLLKGESVSPL